MRHRLTTVARRARREMRILGRRLHGGPRDLAEQQRRAAVDITPTVDRSPVAWWRRETSRIEASRGALPVDAGRGPVVDGVAVVCATNRPSHTEAVIANIARQSIVASIHAVIVLNESDFDMEAIERGLKDAGCARVTVVWVSAEHTLGECLRRGLAATDARYVAKFDDDDVYGPQHLEDSIAALRWSGAAVTGKHSYLVHLDDLGETVVRFPGREWQFVGFVAGGTIVMDRQRTGGAGFGDGNVGEDSALLEAVERAGGLILANSALGYVQFRGASTAANTWQLGPERVRRESASLGHGDLRPLVAAG